MKNDYHIDVTAIIGLIAMGIIGGMAVNHGADGMTVAAAVAGAIGGWLAKSGAKTTTKTGEPDVTVTTEDRS